KRRVMTEDNDVPVTLVIDGFDLSLDPFELFLITCDIRVQSDHKRVSISKRVGRISAEPARRSLGRYELRIHPKKVLQALLSFRVTLQSRAAYVVVARRQKVWNAPILREFVDKVDVTHVQ